MRAEREAYGNCFSENLSQGPGVGTTEVSDVSAGTRIRRLP